eukprot:353072-Chlamydomonas_euryale.AAC.3
MDAWRVACLGRCGRCGMALGEWWRGREGRAFGVRGVHTLTGSHTSAPCLRACLPGHGQAGGHGGRDGGHPGRQGAGGRHLRPQQAAAAAPAVQTL